MDKLDKADLLSRTIIGAAIEVHRELGPGLLESIYQKCLSHELLSQGIQVREQQEVSIKYKNLSFEHKLRCDLLVEDCVLIELKAVESVLPVHKAQLLSYLKLLNLPLGLLINFHEYRLVDGLHRMVRTPSSSPLEPSRPLRSSV